MFKTSERRFEYNINPQGEELDRPRHYTRELPAATPTPLNHKRPSLNYSLLDEHRTDPRNDYPRNDCPRNDERHEPRGRVSSETAIKRSTDRSANVPRTKNQYEEPFKQTKKVYFGAEEGMREYEGNRSRPQRDENRRYNGEDYSSFAQENANPANFKPDSKEKPRRGENRQEISDYGINEKEIMEKIGRINRLNEEINNRLQRMLNKIDGA